MGVISNFGSNASGAVSELFAGFASAAKADMFRTSARLDLLKGEGARLEGENYGRAGELALLNKTFAETSTQIQLAQSDRAVTMALGGIRATVGGSGLRESGSALDILSASAGQGALERAVLEQQGLITSAGYQEEADVYANMVEASKVAVEASKLSSEGHLKAAEAEEDAEMGHYIGGALKGVAAVASLFGV